jgi:hypothetical protein
MNMPQFMAIEPEANATKTLNMFFYARPTKYFCLNPLCDITH